MATNSVASTPTGNEEVKPGSTAVAVSPATPPGILRKVTPINSLVKKEEVVKIPRKPWPETLVKSLKGCLAEDSEGATLDRLYEVLRQPAFLRGAGEFMADEISGSQPAMNSLRNVGAFYNLGSVAFSSDGHLVSYPKIADAVAYAIQSDPNFLVKDDLFVVDYPYANAKFNPVTGHNKMKPNTWLFLPLMTPTISKIVSNFITEHNTHYGKGSTGAISGVLGLLCLEEKKQPTKIDSLVGSCSKPLMLYGVTQTI